MVAPRAATLDSVVAARLPSGLATSIVHVVKIFLEGGGKGDAELSGPEFGLAQSSAFRGNHRSTDQSMVALSIISSMEASSLGGMVL
jgi:hypothetical protein